MKELNLLQLCSVFAYIPDANSHHSSQLSGYNGIGTLPGTLGSQQLGGEAAAEGKVAFDGMAADEAAAKKWRTSPDHKLLDVNATWSEQAGFCP